MSYFCSNINAVLFNNLNNSFKAFAPLDPAPFKILLRLEKGIPLRSNSCIIESSNVCNSCPKACGPAAPALPKTLLILEKKFP
ncbi:hypothetical protein [Orientia tsutsugamushi]|uniref:hypothetical protein n=1 Tax=Orientia tsutsugamushi TaxID=784 RepID=UPI0005F96002|nr:hypothetical protein [Orientia tsutsugamushi]